QFHVDYFRTAVAGSLQEYDSIVLRFQESSEDVFALLQAQLWVAHVHRQQHEKLLFVRVQDEMKGRYMHLVGVAGLDLYSNPGYDSVNCCSAARAAKANLPLWTKISERLSRSAPHDALTVVVMRSHRDYPPLP